MSGTTNESVSRRREPLSQRIYRELRRDLARGEFGTDVKLGEELLAGRYRASRTPVREALARLDSEGLVERRGTGLYPVRPRLDRLGDYFEARTLIEVAALDRMREQRSHAYESDVLESDVLESELARWRAMRDGPATGDFDFVIADERFHRVLVVSSGSAALADALSAITEKIRAAWHLDYPTPGRAQTVVAEHIAIGEAILAGDLDTARTSLIAHIDDSKRLVEAGVAEQR